MKNEISNIVGNMACSLTSLPKEMLIEIWSYLDFGTQKICARVSKEWMNYIRGTTRLSSEIYLDKWNRFKLSVEDINAVLSSWPKLQTLMVSDLDLISQHGINLKDQESLEKIIVSPEEPIWLSKRYSNENQLKELIVTLELKGVRNVDNSKLIYVDKFWLDPRNIMSPITIENVLRMHVR